MSIKALVLAAAAVAGVGLPAVADAQQYGGYGYNGYGNNGYSSGYYDNSYRGDSYREERARERWEHRRWQDQRRYERAQRHYWAREHRQDYYGDRDYRY